MICDICNNTSAGRYFFGKNKNSLLTVSLGVTKNKLNLRQNGKVIGYIPASYCPFCGRRLDE